MEGRSTRGKEGRDRGEAERKEIGSREKEK